MVAPNRSGARSRGRTALVALLAVVVVVGAGLGILRWQADAAAAAYGEDVRAHIERFDKRYRADRKLNEAIERVNAIERTLGKDAGKIEVVARTSRGAAGYFAAQLPTLEREARERPSLRSVPLGATLSPDYEATQVKAARVKRLYDDALLLVREGVEIYPRLEQGYRLFVSFQIFAPIEVSTEGALAQLRTSRAKYTGNGVEAVLENIQDRLDRLDHDRKPIARVAVPARYEPRKAAVLAKIDEQIETAKSLRQQLKAGKTEGKTWDETADAFTAQRSSHYIEPYMYLYAALANTNQRFEQKAKELRAYAKQL